MTIATIAEVNTAIISGDFTNEQLDSIANAIRYARAQIANTNKFTLVKGTKVKFTHSRTGQVIVGNVDKVNRKFILVREDKPGNLVNSIWRVPANMLSAA